MLAAIIEDDYADAQSLQAHLNRYDKAYHVGIQATVFPRGEDFLASYQPMWDVIFMDIALPGLNGMEAAKRLRTLDPKVPLIFVTSMAQYAVNGYEVSALDYIVKPINYYGFSMKMDRVCQLLKGNRPGFLVVKGKSYLRKLPVGSIRYIEVLNHALIYHTESETLSATSGSSLKALENKLHEAGFSQCNKCYLVNLRYVDGIERETVRLGDVSLKISRSKRKSFINDLFDYWGG